MPSGRRAALAALAALCAAGPVAAGERHGFMSLFNWFDTRVGEASARVAGSGRLARQVRPLAGFTALVLEGPVDVVLQQGEVEQATVRADDNLVDLIETRVDAGRLRVGLRAGAAFKTAHPIIVTVEFRHLAALSSTGSGDISGTRLTGDVVEISLRGSGDINIEQLRAEALAVLLAGSGDLHLAGAAPKQAYVLEGSGDIDAEELNGREVGLRLQGSGDAKLRASQTLAVDLTGSGDVSYLGQARLTRTGHGSGDVRHR